MEYYERIKALREDRDILQKQIAEILHTSRSYYGQYERGIRPLPIDSLRELCLFYNVSADYILGLPDLPYPKD